MEPQEKKYLVDSLSDVQRRLQEKKAKKLREVTSVHYYGQHTGNDVEKFVEYADRFEIHSLKEYQGKFMMTHHAQIPDKKAGIAWLKKQGFSIANIVKMEYSEYTYKNGTVGLYTIDDFLRSVILYYRPKDYNAMEKEFGLQGAKVITIPYNKLLDQLGRLRSMKL